MPAKKTTFEDELLIGRLRIDEQGNHRPLRELARLMAEQHGRQLHFSTIARVVQHMDAERRELARTVLEEKLHPAIGSDLAVLEEMLATELEVWRSGRPRPVSAEDDPGRIAMAHRDWNGLSKEIRELVALRLKLSGATADQEEQARGLDVGKAVGELLVEIYRLVPPVRPGETSAPEPAGFMTTG